MQEQLASKTQEYNMSFISQLSKSIQKQNDLPINVDLRALSNILNILLWFTRLVIDTARNPQNERSAEPALICMAHLAETHSTPQRCRSRNLKQAEINQKKNFLPITVKQTDNSERIRAQYSELNLLDLAQPDELSSHFLYLSDLQNFDIFQVAAAAKSPPPS